MNYFKALLITTCIVVTSSSVFADTPIDLFQSYAGNVNFVGAQATRRTQPNNNINNDTAECQVLPATTTNTTTIAGIPTGATIRAAHLYWAGSFSTQSGSTRTTPDYNVVFEGNSVIADRQYTADFDATEQYFSGVENVTSIVQSRGNPNGSYSFSGLSVNTAAPHCSFATVIAGWALVIIYEDLSEDFRVVNLFEGYQLIYGNSVTLTPSNFKIPNSPINGKHAYLTWDGDAGNSGAQNGLRERLLFNGTSLTNANKPTNNIHNSISTINGVDNSSHGVDFVLYTIDSLLSAGDTSATSVYSSGADQVHLSMEIISVTNTEVSDLGVTKTASSSFNVGSNATYNIVVNNVGPNSEPGNIVVTDTLPTGISFVSGTGIGWSCNAAGQNVTCTRAGSLAVGASTPAITLTVSVASVASPSVSNTASVSGTNFDNVSGNNTSTATTSVTNTPAPPLVVGGCDNFENGLGNWTINSNGGGTAEITSATAQSPTQSLDMYADVVVARSITVDTSNNFKELTMWIRRGANSFSETPDSGVNLRVQYRNSSNNWVTLETLTGAGTPGETFNRTYAMPAAAKHPNFRVRIRHIGGGGGNLDHWHVDDVCLVEDTPSTSPSINLQKTSSTLSDPINGNINPKAIPGALAQYVIKATNTGAGEADTDSIVISDVIPNNTALFVGDISGGGTGPIRFADGTPPSGLSYTYFGLGNTSDSLSFSNNNGTSYNYIPSPDAEGVDTSVTNIRVSTQGQFLGASVTGSPSFDILFRVKVQ